MRVSVVATGIDSALLPQAAPSKDDMRLAEMTARVREQAAAQAAQAARVAAPRQAAPAPAPIVVETAPVQPEIAQPVLAPAPVEAAPMAVANDVTLRPMAPKPTLFREPVVEEAPRAPEHYVEPDHFVPPAPERAVVRPPRMPRIEDLPMPAQAQIAAQRTPEAPQGAGGDRKRMTLLQRLAAVGLGRPESEDVEPAPAPVARQPEPRPAPPRPPEAQRRPPAPRPAPQVRSIEDEQLEIPAFLRRQAN